MPLALQSSTITICFTKSQTESIRWICGGQTRSCSGRQESRQIRSIQRISVPGAIRHTFFPTGSWERSGEIWQPFWLSESRDKIILDKKSFAQHLYTLREALFCDPIKIYWMV